MKVVFTPLAEHRVVIAYMVATDTVLIEGIFYGGQNIMLAI